MGARWPAIAVSRGAETEANLKQLAASVGIVEADASTHVLRSGDTMTGRLFIVEGSASNPGLGFGNDTNTGIYRSAGEQISIATAGTQRFAISTRLLGPDGTAATPGYGFLNDANTGLFLVGADGLSVATGGVEAARFRSSQTLALKDGSVSDPALNFLNDVDSGVYLSSTNQVSIATSGTKALEVGSAGAIGHRDGSSAAPSITFINDKDTGIYRAGVDDLRFASGGADSFATGTTTPGIRVADGTVSAPGVRFTADTDTGVFRVGADTLGVVTGGARRVSVASTATFGTGGTNSARILADDTDGASTPSYTFVGDQDTGMYRAGADTIGFVTGGSGPDVTITPGGAVTTRIGSAGAPAFSFTGDSDTGMFRSSSNVLELATGGASRVVVSGSTFTYNGNEIWHAGNDGSGSGLDADTVDGEHASAFADSGHGHDHGSLTGLGDDGDHTWAAIADVFTTSTSPNAVYDETDRRVQRSTSTVEVKTDISAIRDNDPLPDFVPSTKRSRPRVRTDSILNVTPVQFRSLADADDPGIFRQGFLYEDMKQNFPLGANDHGGLELYAIMSDFLVELKRLRGDVDQLTSIQSS